ncbi:TRAM domain-containing protein, partial [Candidatus Microgenomates bacterium]|nr:TRAM domain-containing protein [Candidatus Microgenomates bacterium]
LFELKRIADVPDTLKRARGRQGLEVLNNLKKVKGIKVILTNDDIPAPDIDEKLVRIAKMYKGKLITCDFNLNRKATIGDLPVLNVNELVNALKTRVLPGEELTVKIVQPGKEKEQGVGYLLDGTMIVVENGRERVGETVEVVVSRIFQTAAGRMIFTKLKEN